MASRLELHNELRSLLGSNNVYFQPPESLKIKYPAIVYKKRSGNLKHADNSPYFFRTCYQVVIIDYDPDSPWTEMMLGTFKYCRPEREYAAENLNHWPFEIYY